jgi:hypothetical protein
VRLSKNEPSNFAYMVQFLAARLGMTEGELAALSLENSKRVYRLTERAAEAADTEGGGGGGAAPTREMGAASLEAGGAPAPAPAPPTASSGAAAEAEAAAEVDMGQRYYCTKCSAGLFSAGQLVLRHAVGAAAPAPPSVFRPPAAGEEEVQYCEAVYYLPASLLGAAGSLAVDSKLNVSCTSCTTKIGKQQVDSDGDGAACPCGCALDISGGGVLRVSNARVKLLSAADSAGAAKDSARGTPAPKEKDEKSRKPAAGGGGGGKNSSRGDKDKDREEEEAPQTGGKGGKGGKKAGKGGKGK